MEAWRRAIEVSLGDCGETEIDSAIANGAGEPARHICSAQSGDGPRGCAIGKNEPRQSGDGEKREDAAEHHVSTEQCEPTNMGPGSAAP
jgi:hypothetical protein